VTLLVTVDVQCDEKDCPQWIQGSTSLRVAREREALAHAKANGWKRVRGLDLCPAHAAVPVDSEQETFEND